LTEYPGKAYSTIESFPETGTKKDKILKTNVYVTVGRYWILDARCWIKNINTFNHPATSNQHPASSP
jgi:hypothetical protein